jgi:hypothetical protein
MNRLSLLLVAVLVALVAVGSAGANARTVRDARGDTKGSHWPGPGFVWAQAGSCRGSWMSTETGSCGENDYFENAGPLLDIVSVSHGHRGALLRHRITMARNWGNAVLDRVRGGELSVYVSTDGDAAFERRLDFHVRRGKLVATMRGSGRTVPATRPNRKTVEVAFPRAALGRGVRAYRWFAFSGIVCKRRYQLCGDRSPAGALVAHRVG